MIEVLHIIERVTGEQIQECPDFSFFCPGCECCHGVWTTERNPQKPRWSFDGNMKFPTFAPSILVTGTQPISDDEATRIMSGEKIEPKPLRCHSFVRQGKIQYLPDSTHKLSGKTIDMVPY